MRVMEILLQSFEIVSPFLILLLLFVFVKWDGMKRQVIYDGENLKMLLLHISFELCQTPSSVVLITHTKLLFRLCYILGYESMEKS